MNPFRSAALNSRPKNFVMTVSHGLVVMALIWALTELWGIPIRLNAITGHELLGMLIVTLAAALVASRSMICGLVFLLAYLYLGTPTGGAQ